MGSGPSKADMKAAAREAADSAAVHMREAAAKASREARRAANEAANRVSKAMEQVGNNIENAVSGAARQIGQTIQASVDHIANSMHDAVSRVSNSIDHLTNGINQQMEHAIRTIQQLVRECITAVRELVDKGLELIRGIVAGLHHIAIALVVTLCFMVFIFNAGFWNYMMLPEHNLGLGDGHVRTLDHESRLQLLAEPVPPPPQVFSIASTIEGHQLPPQRSAQTLPERGPSQPAGKVVEMAHEDPIAMLINGRNPEELANQKIYYEVQAESGLKKHNAILDHMERKDRLEVHRLAIYTHHHEHIANIGYAHFLKLIVESKNTLICLALTIAICGAFVKDSNNFLRVFDRLWNRVTQNLLVGTFFISAIVYLKNNLF